MIPRELLAASDFTMVRAELVRALDGDANMAIVLTRIHWRAERDGEEGWWRGTAAQLAKETGLSEDQVNRQVKKLKLAGHLETTKARAEGAWDQTLSYRLVWDELPQTAQPQHDAAALRDVDRANLRDVPSTKTSKDISINFAEFWAAYPRKVGKREAERKYEIATRKTDPGVILAAVKRYAASRAGQDPAYTKHPATWLHQGCWEDDLSRSNGSRLVENTAWSASAWTP